MSLPLYTITLNKGTADTALLAQSAAAARCVEPVFGLLRNAAAGALQIDEIVDGTYPAIAARGNRSVRLSFWIERAHADAATTFEFFHDHPDAMMAAAVAPIYFEIVVGATTKKRQYARAAWARPPEVQILDRLNTRTTYEVIAAEKSTPA